MPNHGRTAAEVVYHRADAGKDNMGLTSWEDAPSGNNGIACDLRDERFGGEPIGVAFSGTLRLDEEAAVSAMLHHDAGMRCAPTAFDKRLPPPQ